MESEVRPRLLPIFSIFCFMTWMRNSALCPPLLAYIYNMVSRSKTSGTPLVTRRSESMRWRICWCLIESARCSWSFSASTLCSSSSLAFISYSIPCRLSMMAACSESFAVAPAVTAVHRVSRARRYRFIVVYVFCLGYKVTKHSVKLARLRQKNDDNRADIGRKVVTLHEKWMYR